MIDDDLLREAMAEAVMDDLWHETVIGMGTGRAADAVMKLMAKNKMKFDGVVASSEKTKHTLQYFGYRVLDLNAVGTVPVYVDGADEVDPYGRLLKGKGGAMLREKIVAMNAERFLVLAEASKCVTALTENCPIPIEVIPMARSYVARHLLAHYGIPDYRLSFLTDEGNEVIDLKPFSGFDPKTWEDSLNLIEGVVGHGIFSKRIPDKLVLGHANGSIEIRQP